MRLEIEFGDLIPFEIQPMNTVHNYTYTFMANLDVHKKNDIK